MKLICNFSRNKFLLFPESPMGAERCLEVQWQPNLYGKFHLPFFMIFAYIETSPGRCIHLYVCICIYVAFSSSGIKLPCLKEARCFFEISIFLAFRFFGVFGMSLSSISKHCI